MSDTRVWFRYDVSYDGDPEQDDCDVEIRAHAQPVTEEGDDGVVIIDPHLAEVPVTDPPVINPGDTFSVAVEHLHLFDSPVNEGAVPVRQYTPVDPPGDEKGVTLSDVHEDPELPTFTGQLLNAVT